MSTDRPPEEPFDTGVRPEELDPERPRPFETPWGSFAIYSVDGALTAAESWCPHLAGPLFQGLLRDGEVACPWHAWVFSLRTGRCVWAPEGAGAVRDVLRLARVTVGPAGTCLVHAPAARPR